METLIASIGLDYQALPGSNSAAYLSGVSVTKKKFNEWRRHLEANGTRCFDKHSLSSDGFLRIRPIVGDTCYDRQLGSNCGQSYKTF